MPEEQDFLQKWSGMTAKAIKFRENPQFPATGLPLRHSWLKVSAVTVFEDAASIKIASLVFIFFSEDAHYHVSVRTTHHDNSFILESIIHNHPQPFIVLKKSML